MKNLTFTQRLIRKRSFLHTLFSLLALLVGLGASPAVQAGVTGPTGSTVFIDQSSAIGANTSYAAAVFDGASLGTYDINTGSLLLNGGSFTTQETNDATYSYAVTNAYIDYSLYLDGGTPTAPIRLALTQTSGPDASGVRSFSLTSAQINLIRQAAVTVGGISPGTLYDINISFGAQYSRTTTSNGSVRSGITLPPDNNGGLGYVATFRVTGTKVVNNVAFTNESVTVDQGNGPVNYPGTAFNTSLSDQKPGSASAPAFDINTGKLILNGGTVTTTETGTYAVNGATLDYTLFNPNGTPVTSGTLQLNQTSVTNGVRTFSLATGTTNLVSLVQVAGINYKIQVTFHATYVDAATNNPARANDNNTYNATFSVSGTLFPAPTISANTISIAPNGNADVVYNINPSTPNPFQGADMSSAGNSGTAYDVNNGQLRLDATSVSTTESGNNIITSVVLYYRTRLSGTGGGAYQPITLTQSTGANGGPKTFILDPSQAGSNNPQPNLISTSTVTAAGTYFLDVYYQANGVNTNTNTTFTLTDPPTGAYSASFTVTGVPVATTIWTGGKNDNWFDTANWSAGIPTATTNALVRDLGAGVSVPYPNITSDAAVTTAGGAIIYDNTGSGPALARNLTMGGSSQASRSITRLIKGQLKVFGNFDNTYDSFIQRDGTIMEFAGGNQTITGGTFVRIDISGGGTKALVGLMNVSQSLNFLTTGSGLVNPYTALTDNAGVLSTNITAPTASLVVLADRAPNNSNNGAQVNGETDASFLFGFARTTRQTVLVGETRTYGNMGLTITFDNVNNPGNVEVTRNTVESYSPLSGRYGIRRIYGVRPSLPQTNSGGLSATMIFHFRDAETKNLGGPNTTTPGTQSIAKVNLVAFVSTNSGNTFGYLGRDVAVDEKANLVTKSGITTFATFTLGDKTNPLPVRLTAFDAKRFGADALITWQTASEENSKGYDVQVSANGTEFRTLTSVPSASPNSMRVTDYRYVDTEANKAGLRYYRLRQVDLDGKEAFFAPVSVSFDGKAAASTVMAYPNPFTMGNELKLDVQSAATGKGQLRITDMTGRTLRQEAIDMQSGITSLSVSNFGELKAGLYLLRVTLPSGETKNLKVVKQ